jgi:hypothetical protein
MKVFLQSKQNPYPRNNTKNRRLPRKRITSYLDLVDTIVRENLSISKLELAENKTALEQYLTLLPIKSAISTVTAATKRRSVCWPKF